eukprot:3151563-Rhodomonas_salina.2
MESEQDPAYAAALKFREERGGKVLSHALLTQGLALTHVCCALSGGHQSDRVRACVLLQPEDTQLAGRRVYDRVRL